MHFKEIIPIILKVIKEPVVIATAVAMLLVMEFARFVVNYTKKPPKPVKVKKTVKTPPPSKKEEKKEGENEEGASEK